MKQHYTKIFLFVFPLNILISLSNAHNKNKIYITSHYTQTNRSLCESDTQSSIYDNDAEIISVKEIFDRQTSQRLREYDERLQEKRQKGKEQRDRNVEEIILKDKMDKSLSEKIEKGCLKCGCALGGGVLPVWGLVSGLWYATLSQYVSNTVAKAATDAGIKAAIEGLGNIYDLRKLTVIDWQKMITVENFKSPTLLAQVVQKVNNGVCQSGLNGHTAFCSAENSMSGSPSLFVQTISQQAGKAAADAGQAAKIAETAAIATEHAKSTYLYSAIGYSVLAILIIVLVLIIIYLILRYRRRKKMNKKAHYTKLINQ
ncbi:rifin [Plasmodium reichenowi]|uniref:Rifin n=1 Tax=Plasmodium reichenowi TaxID=5854 RepID=A0A060RM16_PLARE|nr:rifin [Plasmodium reichenowi]